MLSVLLNNSLKSKMWHVVKNLELLASLISLALLLNVNDFTFTSAEYFKSTGVLFAIGEDIPPLCWREACVCMVTE